MRIENFHIKREHPIRRKERINKVKDKNESEEKSFSSFLRKEENKNSKKKS